MKNKRIDISPIQDFFDLILSDNFFDMGKGEKTVKILSGKPTDLKVKTVFDIK